MGRNFGEAVIAYVDSFKAAAAARPGRRPRKTVSFELSFARFVAHRAGRWCQVLRDAYRDVIADEVQTLKTPWLGARPTPSGLQKTGELFGVLSVDRGRTYARARGELT